MDLYDEFSSYFVKARHLNKIESESTHKWSQGSRVGDVASEQGYLADFVIVGDLDGPGRGFRVFRRIRGN